MNEAGTYTMNAHTQGRSIECTWDPSRLRDMYAPFKNHIMTRMVVLENAEGELLSAIQHAPIILSAPTAFISVTRVNSMMVSVVETFFTLLYYSCKYYYFSFFTNDSQS